jgi:hypothetical protein
MCSPLVLIEGSIHPIHPELCHAIEQIQASCLHLGVTALVIGSYEYLDYIVRETGTSGPYVSRLLTYEVEEARRPKWLLLGARQWSSPTHRLAAGVP